MNHLLLSIQGKTKPLEGEETRKPGETKRRGRLLFFIFLLLIITHHHP
jgi:hypothetical protein